MWFSGSEGQRLPVNPIVKKYHGQQCLQVINRQGRYNRSRGRYGIEDVIRWQYRSNVGSLTVDSYLSDHNGTEITGYCVGNEQKVPQSHLQNKKTEKKQPASPGSRDLNLSSSLPDDDDFGKSCPPLCAPSSVGLSVPSTGHGAGTRKCFGHTDKAQSFYKRRCELEKSRRL
ncbi:hypothetical protein RRG08_061270 [Elysia crispata]|uniref:Uncharacterized protein n=1 Tax=Elysia crispata TaxID=231223 RepID=A0AAE1DFM6_9GAST|nr:hypothetical protein RRG08_061270 [Elysia crispata]